MPPRFQDQQELLGPEAWAGAEYEVWGRGFWLLILGGPRLALRLCWPLWPRVPQEDSCCSHSHSDGGGRGRVLVTYVTPSPALSVTPVLGRTDAWLVLTAHLVVEPVWVQPG
jgi:hypothetical protein